MSDGFLKEMEEISKVFACGVEVTVGGEKIEVTPLKMKQIIEMRRISDELFTAITSGEDLLRTFVKHSDEISELISIVISKPVEWLNELTIDEVVHLLAMIVYVNADLFKKKILPILQKISIGGN